MDSETLFREYIRHVGRLQRYLRGYFSDEENKEVYGYGAYSACIAIHTIEDIFMNLSLGGKVNELGDFEDFLWERAEDDEEKMALFKRYEWLLYPCREIPPHGVFLPEKFFVGIERKKEAIQKALELDEYGEFVYDMEKHLTEMHHKWRNIRASQSVRGR